MGYTPVNFSSLLDWKAVPVVLNNSKPAISPFDNLQYFMPAIVDIKANVKEMRDINSRIQ
jgi:hypothetical protein